MTSRPSMRVAMPTAVSAGGKAPSSGCTCGVSGLKVSPLLPQQGWKELLLLVLHWGQQVSVPKAYRETPNWMNQR